MVYVYALPLRVNSMRQDVCIFIMLFRIFGQNTQYYELVYLLGYCCVDKKHFLKQLPNLTNTFFQMTLKAWKCFFLKVVKIESWEVSSFLSGSKMGET